MLKNRHLKLFLSVSVSFPLLASAQSIQGEMSLIDALPKIHHAMGRTEDQLPVNGGRDYFTSVTKQEKKDITYIINTLSRESLAKIATLNSSLNKAGDRIANIHPLRFLLTVFNEEELKVGMQGIRQRGGWIWDRYSSELCDSLKKEASINNLRPAFIEDFIQRLKIDPGQVMPLIQAERWSDLLNRLIDIIPRTTDPNRYDM